MSLNRLSSLRLWPRAPSITHLFQHSQCRSLPRPSLYQLHHLQHQHQPHQPHQPHQLQLQLQPRRHASILSSLADNRGAYNKRIRRGRGPGSGKGKTSGRGHGGQKARGKPPRGFEGGQTPAWKAQGGRGMKNVRKENMAEVNLDRIQSWVDQGRLNPHRPITMVELHASGCISAVQDGVKILSRGKEHLKTPIHLIVSRASSSAIKAIEAAGGTITTRFYSKFAIAHILRGETHPIHSRLFVPTAITKLARVNKRQIKYALPDPIKRKDLEYYRDVAKRGYLSYMVPVGQTPSLFFKTPGLGVRKVEREAAAVVGQENRLW